MIIAFPLFPPSRFSLAPDSECLPSAEFLSDPPGCSLAAGLSAFHQEIEVMPSIYTSIVGITPEYMQTHFVGAIVRLDILL